MEEQIKRAVRNLNISYVFFWVLPAFLLGAGEFELFPVGGLVDNAPAIYYFETVGILLTALCVPLSLKLYSLVLKKKIDHMTITLALKRYVQWNIVRLGVLEVAIVVNLLCYYLTLSPLAVTNYLFYNQLFNNNNVTDDSKKMHFNLYVEILLILTF